MEISFQVQGSSSDPYMVTFLRDGNTLLATCSCSAGTMGQACKHRLAILTGDTSSIVSDNHSDATVVAGWLPGSPLSTALDGLDQAERQLEAAKRAVAAAKKRVSQAFLGH